MKVNKAKNMQLTKKNTLKGLACTSKKLYLNINTVKLKIWNTMKYFMASHSKLP